MPVSGVCTVHAQSPCHFQAGEISFSKMFSEDTGTDSSCGCHVPARTYAYEAASALAKGPCATPNVAEWPGSHYCDSQVYAYIIPLAWQDYVWTMGFHWQSGQKKSHDNKRIFDGLGSPLRWKMRKRKKVLPVDTSSPLPWYFELWCGHAVQRRSSPQRLEHRINQEKHWINYFSLLTTP